MSRVIEEVDARLEAMRQRLQTLSFEPRFDEFGMVEQVADDIAWVSGLPEARLEEVIVFDDSVRGMAVSLQPGRIGTVLLDSGADMVAGTRARGTGAVIKVPVGKDFLGRVVDPLGRPLDTGPVIRAAERASIDRPSPGITERDLVATPLETGVLVVDALVPLGRGQRELIIGDRGTGKTTLAVDAILHQARSDVVCVYVGVGQEAAGVNRVIEAVRQNGPFERCIFVVAGSDAPLGLQWMAPYAACSMAEYFRDRGGNALLIIDDLTKHAAIHRQLSLLLRDPPGREAYPGDIFHVHAKLLERAAKLSPERGGGSLTALPIAETQAGNLSAYIPTNLISITDGQIYLEPKLFHEGQKPAVNVGLSVSRVGGKTQSAAMRELSETLKLDYAQFLELEIFTRFGQIADARTQRVIEHGRRIRWMLRQVQSRPLPLPEQITLLLGLQHGLLDRLSEAELRSLRARLGELLLAQCADTVVEIEATGALRPEHRERLLGLLRSEVEHVVPVPSRPDPTSE